MNQTDINNQNQRLFENDFSNQDDEYMQNGYLEGEILQDEEMSDLTENIISNINVENIPNNQNIVNNFNNNINQSSDNSNSSNIQNNTNNIPENNNSNNNIIIRIYSSSIKFDIR